MVSENSPFPGAAVCYRRASRLLAWMGTHGFVAIHKKRGRPVGCSADPEMQRLVDALNRGDEETIKSYLIHPDYIGIIHAQDPA